MHRLGAHLISIAALGLASPVLQAQQATKIHMHADSGYAADGLLFEPAGNGLSAALLVIHDEWGLTSSVTDQARRFANAGFVVVAIDLYRGEVALDAQRATQLSGGLSPDDALHDLKAAIMFLAAQPNVRRGVIGVIGWSTGGAVAALRVAAGERQVSAVVINSCEPPLGVDIMGLHAAVLGNFGGCHSALSPSALKNFTNQLMAGGVAVITNIYPAQDGYLEKSHRPELRATDARDAEARTLKFLAATLHGPQESEPPTKTVTPH